MIRRRITTMGVGLVLALLSSSGTAGGASDAIDPAARLSSGARDSEFWDLNAHFDGGQRLFVRFMITNEGPGKRNASVIGHVILSDTHVVPFQNGRRESGWTLGPHGRRLEVGPSILDLGPTSRSLQVIKQKKGIRILLEWTADATAVHLPEPDGSAMHTDVLNLATPIAGSVWERGMEKPVVLTGRATLNHTWTEGRERDQILRRIDVATFGNDGAFFLSDTTFATGDRWQTAAIAHGAQIERVSHTSTPAPPRGGRAGDPYPIPSHLDFAMPGLTGTVTLGDTVLQHDPLDALPVMIRMLYPSDFRPHRAWVESRVEVDLEPSTDHAALTLRDPGIAALTFLDSIPVD